MSDKTLDIENERRLEAKYEKESLCKMHGKKGCKDCDGKDEWGQDCRHYPGEKRIIN